MSKFYELKEGENLATKFEYINHIPGYFLIKDVNSRYQNISPDFVKLSGVTSANKLIGKTVEEVPNKYSEYHRSILNLDQKVVTSSKKVVALDIFDFGCETMVQLCQKTPLKNHRGNVIGIYINSIDMSSFINDKYQFLKESDKKFIGNKFLMKTYTLTSSFSPLPISPRQQACLSLLIRGKTMKEIAYMLGISVRTVEAHFEAIKHKLGCRNKSQLIEKAIESGFLFHIPESLFGLGLLK